MVLLYADVLGMKARWRSGVDAAQAAFRELETIVAEVLDEAGIPATGAVQSDAVAITFEDAAAAIHFGRELYRRCFYGASSDNRLWLRGLLLASELAGDALVEEIDIECRSPLTTRQFAAPLLDAINVEQQFKGPRLLVEWSLVDDAVKDASAIALGDRYIVPLKRLTAAPYPSPVDRFGDVLYLVPERLEDPTMVRAVTEAVSQRMRWAANAESGGSPEEFAQISALALTWMESEAIIEAVRLRS